MNKRQECRKCGAKLKHDKTSDQYDPEYCSGKCRKEDGSEPYVKSAEEKAAVIVEVKKKKAASLEGYKKGVPANYARRFEPEKLNWSANKMNEEELKQAGFRANREPIPGDWDYEEKKPVQKVQLEQPKQWQKPLLEKEQKKVPDTIDGHPEMSHVKKVREPNEWDLIRAKAKGLNIQTHGKKREQVEAEIKEAENAAV